MTAKESSVERAKRILAENEKKPANARSTSTAGDVARVADFALSMEFMVQAWARERVRIIHALGLQTDGPDADQDGYPDLPHLVEEALQQLRGAVALANQRAWQAEQKNQPQEQEQKQEVPK